MTADSCDVLIVGGGPVGVTLAILLARRGIDVLVAEKEPGIYPLPRAAHLDHEAIRILQEAGVADEVMAGCRSTDRYDFLTAAGEVLLRFEGSAGIGPGGWPLANMIHQPSVEAALRRRLADMPGARLESRWEVTALEDAADGLTARIATPSGERAVRAHYVVAADGARSPMRHLAGIAMQDLGFEEPWLVIDTLVLDAARLPAANLQICDPARPTTCVLMGEGRHRWEFMIRPGEDADALATDDSIAALLAPWNVEGAVTLERKAIYTFRARIAERWRKGRLLLAGDAAHQTPPFAGQGLCSGLRDAANIGWKLAMVLKGDAADTILDSYQPEREPNLRATIDMAMLMGRTVCITDPEAAAARDAQMLAARAAGHSPDGALHYPAIAGGLVLAGTPGAGGYFPQPVAGGARLDSVSGDAPFLLTREMAAIASLAPFRAALLDWLDAHSAEAVLVRPDHHVFGTGPAEALLAAWNQALGRAA